MKGECVLSGPHKFFSGTRLLVGEDFVKLPGKAVHSCIVLFRAVSIAFCDTRLAHGKPGLRG